jgi:hypothetical protein
MVVRTPHCAFVSVSVSSIDFREHSLFSRYFQSAYQSDFNVVAMSMRVAYNRVQTTIISQLFGVNRSAIPGGMQNHFKY